MRLLADDESAFTMRIAKKKNGYPNFDYPSKINNNCVKHWTLVIEFS